MNRTKKRPPKRTIAPRERRAGEPAAQEALEASGLAWWELDVGSGRVRLSGLWRAMLGGPREPVTESAENLLALVPEEERAAVAAVFYGALKGERDQYQVEHRVRTPEGGHVWVRAAGRVTARDASGKARRLNGTLREISDEVRARQALARSEARFRQLTQIYSDWFWELDEELRFRHIEGKGLEKIGIRPADAIGTRALDLSRYRLISMSVEQFDELRRKRLPYREVLACFDMGDGSQAYVSVTGEPLFDPDGTFRGYRGVTRDITERMLAEQALRQSESRFKGAFESSAVGMAIVAPDGRLLQVNQALCDLVGYSQSELLNRDFQSITHPGDLEANLEQLHETLSGKRNYYQIEKRYVRKDGRVIWVQLNASAVRDAQGELRQFITQIQDATARRNALAHAEHLALHDALTGLANRRLLPDRIAQAIAHARRTGARVGVVFIDLDGFKPVNDRLGHAAGDHLLKEIAHRLRATLRENDSVARAGGDEFVAVVSVGTEIDELRRVAQRLLDHIAQPCAIGHDTAQVSASLGIALFPDDADAPEDLLRKADAAMYEAKRAGRGTIRFAQELDASP